MIISFIIGCFIGGIVGFTTATFMQAAKDKK